MSLQIGRSIQTERRKQKLTLSNLSQLTGLSISYLSLLERNLNSPTVENLNKICSALGINMADLIVQMDMPDDIVVKSNERTVFINQPGYCYETATDGKRTMSCIIIKLNDDATHYAKPHTSDEIGYVTKGSLIMNVNNVDYELNEGDCIYIERNSTHFYRKNCSGECESVWVSTKKTI